MNLITWKKKLKRQIDEIPDNSAEANVDADYKYIEPKEITSKVVFVTKDEAK